MDLRKTKKRNISIPTKRGLARVSGRDDDTEIIITTTGSNKIPKVGGQNGGKSYSQVPPAMTGMIMMNGVQTLIVEKTEAVVDIGFNAPTYYCKGSGFYPGSAELPWLQSISAAFVEYQVLELEYTYIPSVPTTQAGNVMLSFSGDWRDLNPTTVPQFLQSEQALLAPVYAGGAGGRALQKFGFPNGDIVGFSVPKYTYCVGLTKTPQTYRILNNSTFQGLGDIEKNLYSPGKLMVAVNGLAGASGTNVITAGQIFVRYKVRLLGAVSNALNG